MRDNRRVRAALPPLDRPAPQGRDAEWLVPAADLRPSDGSADPGLALHVRAADRRPGGRRLRRDRGPRPADPARPSRGPGTRPRGPRGRAARGARAELIDQRGVRGAADITTGGPLAMRIGFVGLGRMGANMVRRLVRDGHEVVAYNRTPEKTKEI